MLNFDDDFGLDDLIEADIEYGLFEDDDKKLKQKIKKPKKKEKKNFWDVFRG